jgi:hypothetical protein
MTIFRLLLSRACALCVIAGSPAALAADASVVGTWLLQSWVTTSTETGATSNVFGEHPTGYLIYTAGGHMAVVLSADGRTNLSADRYSSPVEERAQAFSTHVAYSGTYDVTPEGIMHHVKASLFQNWVGTDQFRYVEVAGDTMTIRTPPLKGPPDGKTKVTTLVLKRLD